MIHVWKVMMIKIGKLWWYNHHTSELIRFMCRMNMMCSYAGRIWCVLMPDKYDVFMMCQVVCFFWFFFVFCLIIIIIFRGSSVFCGSSDFLDEYGSWVLKSMLRNISFEVGAKNRLLIVVVRGQKKKARAALFF